MEIRDPVHGSIHILPEERSILANPFFQRLRNIKQLGLSEYVFPGATHTRFLHSLGVMFVATRAFERLFAKNKLQNEKEKNRLAQTFKMACLLHDIGHAPLSHSTESVMPNLNALNIPNDQRGDNYDPARQATHEDYTIKSIVDSSLSEDFKELTKSYGVDQNAVADLIRGITTQPEYFTLGPVNYFPILSQLVSSELDCDRMDYLLRDSYFCGVSYGQFDLDWLLDNMEPCVIDGQAYLGISERAVVTFDDFLLSRYHMFVMVYFHYKAVCLEQLLSKYFESAKGEYEIPASIEEYLHHDDYYLMKVLKNSSNSFAKAIMANEIPPKIFESFNDTQLATLEKAQDFLESSGIEFIRCSSSGRLSKYYSPYLNHNYYPIKVIRKAFRRDVPEYFDINEATELYRKFSKSHAVNRLHCHFDTLDSSVQNKLYQIIGPVL